jgi:hypothetical protein
MLSSNCCATHSWNADGAGEPSRIRFMDGQAPLKSARRCFLQQTASPSAAVGGMAGHVEGDDANLDDGGLPTAGA